MKILTNKINFYFVLAIIVILIFIIFQFIYITWDKDCFGSDGHLRFSLYYYDWLVIGGNSNIMEIPFPPLVYFTSIIFYIFNDISSDSARLSLVLYSIIFLLSMYGIGKELGDEYSGLITMAVAASSPVVLELSRRFYLDYPQTALTALAFYMLIKSKGFRIKNYSILLGITLALSFLAKWSTAFFLAFPVLWICLTVFSEVRKKPRRFLLLMGYILIMAAVTIIYYSMVKPFGEGMERYWYIFYLSAFIIPSIIWYYLNKRVMESSSNANKNKPIPQDLNTKSNTEESLPNLCINNKQELNQSCRITNFGLYLASFTSISGLWYFWAAGTVINKLHGEAANPGRDIPENLKTLAGYALYGMNYYPVFQVFLLIGLIFLTVKFKEYYAKSIVYYLIPLNLIFISLLMWRIGFIDFRYYMSILIFMTPLACYWTHRLKKLRFLVLMIILLMSFFSITEWMTVSHIDHYPVNKYYTREFLGNLMGQSRRKPNFLFIGSSFPRIAGTRFDELTPWLCEGVYTKWEQVLTFIYPYHDNEFIELRAEFLEQIIAHTYKEGRGINPKWLEGVHLRWLDRKDSYVRKRPPKESMTTLLEPWDISKKIITRIKARKDSAAENLYIALSQNSRFLLDEYVEGTEPSGKLQAALVQDLNELISRPLPLDQFLEINIEEDRFLFSLKKRSPGGESMILLNRSLLETAFSKELNTGFDYIRTINELDKIGNVIIIRRIHQDPKDTIKEVEKIFPGVKYERKDFTIAYNFIATLLRLKRDGAYYHVH